MNTERKRGDKGAPRSEVVAVRFDPRTRYLLEIAARAQRRSIANYIEWAVGMSFEAVDIQRPNEKKQSVADAADFLWSIDKAERIRLLTEYPYLLTYEEHEFLRDDADKAQNSTD